MPNTREKDPTQLPVQLNARVPFWLREVLADASAERRVSQGEILRRALEVELRPEIYRFMQTVRAESESE